MAIFGADFSLPMDHPELLFIFFVIALVYASVGFGGGSSYLAVLALYALPYQELRLIALTCNLVVVTGNAIIYIRNKQLNWQKVLPLVLLSVPAAYVGASIRLSQHTFYVLVGCSLIAAAFAMLFSHQPNTNNTPPTIAGNRYLESGLLGGSIGFLSGVAGIGGGIFLAPVLHLLHWDGAKKIAATATVFILVNSVAGVAGQLSQWPFPVNVTFLLLLCVAVLAGGQAGARLSVLKFNPVMIRRVTAAVIFVAGSEVLYRHLPALLYA